MRRSNSCPEPLTIVLVELVPGREDDPGIGEATDHRAEEDVVGAGAERSRTRAVTAPSCSPAVRPSGLLLRTPTAIWSFRPATRTWKNSSRFWLKMARNLTRSNKGVAGSSARASTRALKSSQDISRLR